MSSEPMNLLYVVVFREDKGRLEFVQLVCDPKKKEVFLEVGDGWIVSRPYRVSFTIERVRLEKKDVQRFIWMLNELYEELWGNEDSKEKQGE